MAAIKGKDTAPERTVRSIVHRMGYRFRLYGRDLPGNPDIVLPRYHKVIFIHGCFWHGHKGCRRSGRPATRVRFWNRKIDGNMIRDKRVRRKLLITGWKSLVIWQCQVQAVSKRVVLEGRIRRFLG